MIKISACVITKNEAIHLPRWLHSMSQISDEMIVVDTGSTDNTKTIAKASGAKVYVFPWINNFAAAKNYALDKAKGDWIIFLDADEYFADDILPKLHHKILEINRNKKINAFICRMINIDVDDNNRVINSFYQLRIFRNKSSIRYEGAVHEALSTGKDPLSLMLLPRDIYIYHTGYSNKVIDKKLKRNLKMMQDDIRVNGEKKKYYKPLADCYYGLGNYKKAVVYNQKIIDSDMTLIGIGVDIYIQYIHALCMLDESKEKIDYVINKGLEKYPTSSDLNYQKGYFLYDSKNYVKAEKYLQKALQYYKKYEQITSTNMEQELFLLYGILGDIYALQDRREKAIKYYIESLQEKSDSINIFNKFSMLIKTSSTRAKVKLLDKIYTKKNKKFILNILQYTGEYKLYIYYKNKFSSTKNFTASYGGYQIDSRKITALLDKIYKKVIMNTLSANVNMPAQISILLPQNYQAAFQKTKSKFRNTVMNKI